MSELDLHPAIKKVQDELMCPICLDTAQLPVNFTCFRGCGGQYSNSSTCLRSTLCMHCANDALQLGLPPVARFRGTGGFAHCLICRDMRVDARMLTPDNAYAINHNVLGIMDALGMGAICRQCDKEMGSQAALYQHYQRRCPAAVVKCRFRGCSHWHNRRAASAHEDTCSVGRSPCGQCGAWVDRSELLRHMVTTCRLRVVNCVLCKHSALLPDMLEHLRLHQKQLQGRARARAAVKAVAASSDSGVVELPASAGSGATQAADVAGPKLPGPHGGGATTAAIASTLTAATPVPAAVATLPQAAQSQTFGVAAAEQQLEPQRQLQPRFSAISRQPQQSAWAPRRPLAHQELGYLSEQAPQFLEMLRRQQQLLQRLQMRRQASTLGLVVQQQEQQQQEQRQPGVSLWQGERMNQLGTLAAPADIGHVPQAAGGRNVAQSSGANLAPTPVLPSLLSSAEVAGAAAVAPGVAAAAASIAVAVGVEGPEVAVADPASQMVDFPFTAPEQHGSSHGTDVRATVTASNNARRGISSFAIVTESDGGLVDDASSSSGGGSSGGGGGSNPRSPDLATMQQDDASPPTIGMQWRAPWLGIHTNSSGAAGSSGSSPFADITLHRTPSWRAGLGGPAGLSNRRSGGGASYLPNISSSGNHGGEEHDEYNIASESSIVSTAAADEAMRMVRTAAAIVRASAAASERRTQRQQLPLASAAACCSGGAPSSGVGTSWQASAGGAGAAMAAAWWGVAGPGSFGRSHAPAVATAEMEQTDQCTSSSRTPAVATIGTSSQSSVAAGPPQNTSLPNGIRRSFSDTELVFDVLEELVRASTSTSERRAVRISASGI
ncbi:hypothetical protein Vretimale_2475 [Volvox reticuliferus]|nr:hypothetical protein Vretimale_2475 [Volvox reticuliferus]